MDIVLIGSGNVAAVLGRKFRAAGHRIVQIYSRNASDASALAYEFDSESTTYKSLINGNAEIYIIAVPDDAIASVVDNLKLPGKLVAHTAAAVPKEILKDVTSHYGVFYPLQTLRKEMLSLPEMPVFFDGSDERSRKLLQSLAYSIADVKVMQAGDDARLKMHVAAVIVSNFTNHLYTLAADYCREEGLDFKQLIPLIEQTALRVRGMSPALAQTGPAVRHDEETIQRHLHLLQTHPALKEIYEVLTKSISGTATH